MNVSKEKFSKLLRDCAKAMDTEDQRRAKAEEPHWHAVAGSPTVKGEEICIKLARAAGMPEWGYIAYLLLAYTWNDALDWAQP